MWTNYVESEILGCSRVSSSHVVIEVKSSPEVRLPDLLGREIASVFELEVIACSSFLGELECIVEVLAAFRDRLLEWETLLEMERTTVRRREPRSL